jgi:hypothetical protein
VQCIPSCEQLLVDNKPIDDPSKPFELEPGRHTIKAMRSGYVPVQDTVDVVAGKPFSKEYRLLKPGKMPGPSGDCGQFLRPCN